MPKNPPEGYPRISPYLYYEDGAAAIDWLVGTFGFSEKMRMAGDSGRIEHAELELDGGVVMLGTPPDYSRPSGTSTHMTHVYVDDVDAHCKRAKAAGAKITRDLEDQFYGDRNYGVEDLEGHHWWFAQHVRDVSPEEMQAATAAN